MMFGLHKGRRGLPSVLILSSFLAAMVVDTGLTQNLSVSQTAPASTHDVPDGKERMMIVISDDRPPAIVPAGDGLVVPLPERKQRAKRDETTISNANLPSKKVSGGTDLLNIKQDVLLAQHNTTGAKTPINGDVRLSPPTALDLLGYRNGDEKPTTVAALPAPSAPVQTPVGKPRNAQIEQVQFAPGALEAPKAIIPPRAQAEPEVKAAPSTVFLPSPPKPFTPEVSEPAVVEQPATVQQTAFVPNVVKAPKTAALKTAPSPDNQLVELVETPSDQTLTLSVDRAQLLNLGAAVSDIFVADPNIADVKVVSPQKLFVHGNKLGRTNIFGIDSRGEVVFALDLEVGPNGANAQSQLKALSPNGQTNIHQVSEQLIAEGVVGDVGEAMQVAALSDQLAATEGPTANNTVISGSQQVNLRVRFAEVSREDVVNLGVNWNALGNTGDFLIGLSNGPDVGDLVGLAGDLAGSPDNSGGIPGTGDINVEVFIDALHQEGIISLLAEPNLTAINGETGEFLAGSEIPIPTPGPDGQTYIEYKQVGVSLEYLPTLLPGNRINLRIRPEVSSPSPTGGVLIDGFAIPAFTVRRTETSVELASGQTMALAGLFQRDISTDINKFPILGDLPILGKLFRSERYQRAETELVILITPYLVKPTSNPNLALPNDRIDTATKPLRQGTSKRRAGFIVN